MSKAKEEVHDERNSSYTGTGQYELHIAYSHQGENPRQEDDTCNKQRSHDGEDEQTLSGKRRTYPIEDNQGAGACQQHAHGGHGSGRHLKEQ